MSKIKLKICGVKSVDEVKQLADLGVDYIGLNFVPTSSRCISIEMAESIMSALEKSTVQAVALFQDHKLEIVNDYVHRLNINFVQLHGDESADYAKSVEATVIKAIAVEPSTAAGHLIDYITSFPADYFLLDRFTRGLGEIVNPQLAAKLVAAQPTKIFLAGGLTPTNLAGVLARVHPYAIDISSGVRSGSSIDMAKVANCLQCIRKN